MKRLFTIKDRQFETEATGKEVHIDETYIAKVTDQKENKYFIRLNGIRKEVWILERKKDTYIIGVDGKEVEVSVTDPFGELRTKMGFHELEEAQENDVKAPMPGKLIEILVKEGDEIEEGNPLFILEAMKMENIVKSPTSGVVSSIESQAGETVQKNDVIIKF